MKHPTSFIFDAEHGIMVAKAPGLARDRFTDGKTYLLVDVEERSARSHDHEFAWLAEAFKHLPEHLTHDFPSPEHLRKRALIDAGFYQETIVDCGTKAAAERVAAFMRADDGFAVAVVRGCYAIKRVARSQSRRTMDKVEFQASKTAILEIVSALIGVTPDRLTREATPSSLPRAA